MAETKKIFAEQERKEALVPMSSSQKIIIMDMERSVINDAVLRDCGMDLSGDPYKIYTVVAMFLRACIVYLDTNGELDLAGLIDMKRDCRTNDEAEKTGNYVAEIRPGYILKAIAENQNVELGILEVNVPGMGIIKVPVEKDFGEKQRIILERIQSTTAKYLAGYKYGLNPDDWTIYIISFLAIKHALIVSMKHAMQSDSHKASVNFADLIEMTTTWNDQKNTFKVKCQPGKEAKLGVKSDRATEG